MSCWGRPMHVYTNFATNHLPALLKYAVAIAHEDDDGTACIGSGVFVTARGRHFIATAEHCIRRNPQVMVGDFHLIDDRIVARNPLRILASRSHASLDIGLLEVESPNQPELQQTQLCCDRI